MSGDSDRYGEPAPGGEPEDWGDVDVDAAFAAIVAQFEQTDPEVGPWPAAEDLDGPRETSAPLGPPVAAGEHGATGGSSASGEHSTTAERGPADPATPAVQAGPTGTGPAESARPVAPGDGAAAAPTGGGSPGPAAGTARPEELPRTGGRHVLEPPRATGGLGEALGRATDEHRTAGPTPPDDEHLAGDEEGYVPPEPPPIGRGDFITTFAWVCVLGGPTFLLVAAVVWRDLPGGLLLAALAAFVGGFVLLVARLPGEPPDDPDDGAVV